MPLRRSGRGLRLRLSARCARTTARSSAALIAMALGLVACVSGPDYRRPALDLPVAWKLEAPWRTGTPADTTPKGPWWQQFGDAQLDALEQRAVAHSASLAVAQARLAQARAGLASTAAGSLPQLSVQSRAARQKISANRPLSSYGATNFSTVQDDFTVSLAAGYEADLAGRVQRAIEGAQASVEQSAADLENTRLLLTADLATAYFNLRAVDIETDALNRSIAWQRRALDLVTARRDLGAATGLDVAQQQALLETTRVQIDLLARQRGLFEHALATLSATPAPAFALAPDARPIELPAVPLGVPSDVLERRPDVAAAERAMAVANAQIGVARAAFYPSITLGVSGGLESRALESLFDASSLLWSAGVSAAQVLFDNGRLQAGVAVAQAGHAAAVANYRRVVLGAMQEVQDGITGLAALERAAAQASLAVTAAQRVLDMATARYEGGASAYLEVITAQQGLLSAERQAAQLRGQQLVTSVFLVKSLGGDWQGATRSAAAARTAPRQD